MAESLQYGSNAGKVFVFDQVYTLSAATEQANKKKLNAFGMLAKLNPFKSRPRDDTVLLSKRVLRYEPFGEFPMAGRSVAEISNAPSSGV